MAKSQGQASLASGQGEPFDLPPFRVPVERSRLLHEEARKYSPAGVQGAGRYYAPFPLFMKKAFGARLWDVDGNEYIDYHASYGPASLGYNEPRVRQAVIEAMETEGILFAQPHPREVDLCKTFTEMIPYAQKTTLHGGGGSDALYNAVRLARAYTGRSKILKFEGGYHGWHDELALSVRPTPQQLASSNEMRAIAASAGALPEHAANTIIAPFNDTEIAERLVKKCGRDLAAIFIEPVAHSCGCLLMKPGFLKFIRQLCDAAGCLLVFDEIITGFRHGLQGAGAREGVHPDLAAFGKAIANGFIIAALTGRNDVMSLMAPEGPCFFSGTFNGHLLSVAACQKTIEIMRTEPVHEKLFRLGKMIADGINQAIAKTGIKAVCNSYGSIWCIYFTVDRVDSYRDIIHFASTKDSRIDRAYHIHLLNHGIYIQPNYTNRAFISYAHSEEDVQKTIDVSAAFFKEHAASLARSRFPDLSRSSRDASKAAP
jgi:glutamate-1-semialdehyde 2,1-aminomutase